MAKELPYFRFTVAEWLEGDIGLEDYETKGVFIDICAYYWFKDCNVTMEKLSKRFPSAKQMIMTLLDANIIKADQQLNYLSIDFLDDQYEKLSGISAVRSKAGKMGGLAKAGKRKAKAKQMPIYKDKDKDKDKEKEKDNIPHFFSASEYYHKSKFKARFPEWSTELLTHYYNSLKLYSEEKGEVRADWGATAERWAMKDQAERSGPFKNGGSSIPVFIPAPELPPEEKATGDDVKRQRQEAGL